MEKNYSKAYGFCASVRQPIIMMFDKSQRNVNFSDGAPIIDKNNFHYCSEGAIKIKHFQVKFNLNFEYVLL